MPKPLFQSLAPAGPVVDPEAAGRLHETLSAAAQADGWADTLTAAWPALAPVAGAAPYLAGLMRRRPTHLRRLLETLGLAEHLTQYPDVEQAIAAD